MLAGGEAGNVLAPLFIVAGEEDVVGAERVVRGDGDAYGSVNGGELFHGEDVVYVAEVRAAELGGKDDAEQAHGAELPDDGERELAGFVPSEDVGRDFAGGKVADGLAELLLLFGKDEGIKAFYGFQRNGHVYAPVRRECGA